MTTEVTMPKMGLTMTTATVGKWLKNEGDSVAKGDELVEVTTDKITNVVDAPADGVLLKIAAREGAELPPSGLLGIIGAAGESVASDAPAAQPAKAEAPAAAPASTAQSAAAPRQTAKGSARIVATPLARAVAARNGLDLARVQGTGPGGRIVRADVDAALAAAPAAPLPAASAPAAAPITLAIPEDAILRRVPYTGMRRAIGQNMSASWAAVPRVTQHSSADVQPLLSLRAKINEDRPKEEQVSLTDMLVKIVARALTRMPTLNGVFDGKEFLVMGEVNMGIAVALEDGLTVPVIRSANRKSLFEISREAKDLVAKAKSNRLGGDDMAGGSFTISNEGVYRSVDHFSPIINLPQVAILGIGRTLETPVAENGALAIRPVMGLSLTHDHRVVDGGPAAEFMAVLLELLADPLRSVL